MKYALIMAGGAGTRLWPFSTRQRPKQFIPLHKGKSLLGLAIERLDGFVPTSRCLICTGERFRSAIRETLPEVTDEQIIGEPEPRDTLAAIGLPAAILAKRDPEAVMAVVTADQIIEPKDLFLKRLKIGCKLVTKHPNAMVTFGIEPTEPRVDYGYLHIGDAVKGSAHSYQTRAFKEKPDAATAAEYYDDPDGAYFWNAGMFVWRADTLLRAIARYEPEAHAGLIEIADAWDTPERDAVLARVYPTLRRISVDFAVMERAAADDAFALMTVAMPVRWLDVGTWPSYGSTLERDGAGNQAATDNVMLDTTNAIVVSDDPDHLIATVGVDDLIVVHTAHATLICPRDKAEDLKRLHDAIGKEYGDKYL